MFTRVKSTRELHAMREGGHILATVLQLLRSKLEPDMSTKDLANIAAKEVRRLGGVPTILGYQGFPDVICISLNDEVVHGIPSEHTIIRAGDIVSLDFCVTYQNLITDAALSVIAGGKARPEHAQLLQRTESALMAGINAVHDGVTTGDIGAAVEAELLRYKYGIVRDMVGHGVGDQMHEDPNIPNYGKRSSGSMLTGGMTIAIEPMSTLGSDRVYLAPDGWTIRTWDGSWSAHFEHTVAVSNEGAEILTQV